MDEAELRDRSQIVGSDFRVVTPGAAKQGVALRGDYRLQALGDGLILHSSDAVEQHDLVTEVMQNPGLTLSLFFEGAVDVMYGDQAFRLGTSQIGDEPPSPAATLLARSRAERFVRRSRRGMRVRKVHITVTPGWLAGRPPTKDIGIVHAFADTHLAFHRFVPSARLVGLAEQILAMPTEVSLAELLHLESRALDMLAEAFADLITGRSESNAPATDWNRARAIKAFLDSHLDGFEGVDAAARQMGLSPSTLQRLFRSAYRSSIVDYVRGRRLDLAREALEKAETTIAQAAHTAGFSNSANFSTAFKKRFGLSPSKVRPAF